MTKLRTIVVCVLLFSAGAYGLSLAAAQSGGNRARRRDCNPPSHCDEVESAAAGESDGPIRGRAAGHHDGSKCSKHFPARPISGERLVRPDGTISLGFYGDLYVSGLTLSEIKTKAHPASPDVPQGRSSWD